MPKPEKKWTRPDDPLLFRMPRHYVCYRAGEPVKIDGDLTKDVWKDVPWTEDFQDIDGDIWPRPKYRTHAKMLWDDEYLYVAAELEEPHVWATLTERNSRIFDDPDFEVFIDPDSDNHRYFEFEMNAFNTVWNLFLEKPYRNGGPIGIREMPGQKTGVQIQGTINNSSDIDTGWTLEIAFPWSGMAEHAECNCPPKHGDQWRIGFSRVEWDIFIEDGKYVKVPTHSEFNWIWSAQGLVDMHRPERWPYVQFSTRPLGTDEFKPSPTIPARNIAMMAYYAAENFRRENGRWLDPEKDGLDLPLADMSLLAEPLKMEVSEDGFLITAAIDVPGEGIRRVHVDQTSRIWEDSKSC